MASAAARPGPWRTATVVDIRRETATAKTFRLRLAERSDHLPGQHHVVRLTAPDGYTASRSYSVASAPEDTTEIELTVERLRDGEVSTFLHDEFLPGDQLEVRGPIGGWFVWRGDTPALLVGGGSGVVPLMAMLRHARRLGRSDQVRLVVSVPTAADLYYADEIAGAPRHPSCTPAPRPRPPSVHPAGCPGMTSPPPRCPTQSPMCADHRGFADAASELLVELGVPVERIRVERFGPT